MERISMLGLPVDVVSMDEAVSVFSKLLEKDELSVIVTANSIMIEDATRIETLAKVFRNAALVIPDGIGLVYASRIKGMPLKERITGIGFSMEALKYCAEHGKNVFFLGGKPGVAQAAAERLMKDIPGLNIAGCRDGYFTADREDEVIAEINAAETDFICVAMGSPKQELFLEKHAGELCAKVGVGIGGCLDVWSGNVKRAPQFYQDHGLEWLYRSVKEPFRIKRLFKIPVFLAKVLFDK